VTVNGAQAPLFAVDNVNSSSKSIWRNYSSACVCTAQLTELTPASSDNLPTSCSNSSSWRPSPLIRAVTFILAVPSISSLRNAVRGRSVERRVGGRGQEHNRGYKTDCDSAKPQLSCRWSAFGIHPLDQHITVCCQGDPIKGVCRILNGQSRSILKVAAQFFKLAFNDSSELITFGLFANLAGCEKLLSALLLRWQVHMLPFVLVR
jgi:hypothetical protein